MIEDITDYKERAMQPNSVEHQKLVELVRDCYKLGHDKIQARYDKWKKAEKMDRSYVDIYERDSKGKLKNPFERQIYIPETRAIADTLITYMMSAIIGKRPIIPIQGRGAEDVEPAKLMEVIIDYQLERQRAILRVYNALRDLLKYGLFSIKNTYGRTYRQIFVPERKIEMFPVPRIVMEKTTKDVLEYEGPILTNNDPYLHFFDTRRPFCDSHQGQFMGDEYERSYYYLRKKQSQGIYQNVDYLKEHCSGTEHGADYETAQEERNDLIGITRDRTDIAQHLDKDNPMFTLREFCIELIPRRYKLGESESPEIWKLVCANDKVMLSTERSPYAHGKFPEVHAEFDFDGYSLLNQGYYEQSEGLQDLHNWMINSHISNVRRHIHNRTFVDPSAVELRDLLKPNPAGVVRLKKALWKKGINIDQVAKQMQVYDVTKGHLKDLELVSNILSKRWHASDAMQGVETEVKRTATEIAAMRSGGGNHLAMHAQLVYIQAFVELGEQVTQNNQQFLSEERYYRIAGDWAKSVLQPDPRYKGGNAIKAGPMNVQGLFDFKINDGTLPINPKDNAQMWKDIIKTAGEVGLLQARLDAMEMFKEFAHAMNVKDIDRFDLQARVMPDQQLANMAQAGNIVPMNERPGVPGPAARAA